MYEFWYDYVKPKCDEKAKLWLRMQIVHIKTGDIYGDIAKGVEKRFGTLIMH